MNLSTARSSTRTEEVGIRKVTGGRRKDLIQQFLGETILLSILALSIAVFLVELMMPAFNELAGKELSLHIIQNMQSVFGLLGIVLLTSILAGSYPALYLSSFHPTGVFKTVANLGSKRSGTLRKILVIGQFSYTIILIGITMVIYSQLQHIQNRDLAFDKDNMI